jgi:hypothetical protein
VIPVFTGPPHDVLFAAAVFGAVAGFGGGMAYSWLRRTRFHLPRRPR